MTNEKSNNVRDFVLPVCDISHGDDGYAVKQDSKLVGTCFLIGDRGFALTAAHVLHQVNNDLARVLFPDPEGWDACLIEGSEVHPSEDIALIKLDLPRKITSPIVPADHEPFPSLEYHMWAYPDVIAKEYMGHERPADALDFNPSPVYFRGYVRRKLPYSPNPQFDMYVGKNFYEVSEIGGACCSGAPLATVANSPGVFAIYIGDEMQSRRCGYATNLMRVLDWTPGSLGKPLRDEFISPEV